MAETSQTHSSITLSIGSVRNLQWDERQEFQSLYPEIQYTRTLKDQILLRRPVLAWCIELLMLFRTRENMATSYSRALD